MNCILWANLAAEEPQIADSSAPSCSLVEGWTGGGALNLNEYPQFEDPDNRNFHLIPTASPAVDAGCLLSEVPVDFEGDPRGFDGAPIERGDGSDYDIGADEFHVDPVGIMLTY